MIRPWSNSCTPSLYSACGAEDGAVAGPDQQRLNAHPCLLMSTGRNQHGCRGTPTHSRVQNIQCLYPLPCQSSQQALHTAEQAAGHFSAFCLPGGQLTARQSGIRAQPHLCLCLCSGINVQSQGLAVLLKGSVDTLLARLSLLFRFQRLPRPQVAAACGGAARWLRPEQAGSKQRHQKQPLLR